MRERERKREREEGGNEYTAPKKVSAEIFHTVTILRNLYMLHNTAKSICLWFRAGFPRSSYPGELAR